VFISFIYSKRAREERAIAAEKRLRALQDQAKDIATEESDEESDDEIEIVETDAERRQILLNSGEQENDLQRLDKANSWKEFRREFNFDYTKDECDLPVASGSTFTTTSTGKKEFEQHLAGSSSTPKPSTSKPGKSKVPSDIGLGKLVQNEIQSRKREALGLAGPGRTLADSDDEIIVVSEPRRVSSGSQAQWECLICTL
jgi:hypothetical protein